MKNSVSIATKPLVYSAFRYISNKVHNALAEYVDNSIQSYIDNIDLLSSINPNNKLSIWISIDSSKDIITIKDNAYGISEKYYEKAFELAHIPLDASGLNEFGMGMKVSSIWLSNLWSVETSAYGENYKKTLIFDLEDVVQTEKLELDVKSDEAPTDAHYTLITLQKLSQNKPAARQIPGIKKHLTSIYSRYIKDGILDLYINDELQSVSDLKPLHAPYYGTPEASPETWVYPIEYDAGEYHVKGFIGILDKMSTSTDNGFLLFRRGRVIGSSYEDRYRPHKLCGDVGSPRYKRIYGELELEGFHVSFTKNSFTEGDDFEEFIELLAEELERKEDFRIFKQAQNYKAREVITPKVAKSLTARLADTFSRPVITTAKEPIVSNIVSTIDKNTSTINSVNETTQVAISPETEEITSPQNTEIMIDGYNFELEVGHIKDHDPNWLYDLKKMGDDKYKTQFNLKHKYFERFASDFKSEDGYLPVATFIKAMVSTELALMNGGDDSGNTFRSTFNKLIGQI